MSRLPLQSADHKSQAAPNLEQYVAVHLMGHVLVQVGADHFYFGGKASMVKDRPSVRSQNQVYTKSKSGVLP
jgi:hypothetical protein